MNDLEMNFTIPTLGKCTVDSPMKSVRFVPDNEGVLYDSHSSIVRQYMEQGKILPTMELAGPREKIYFDPPKLKCGIVTCGGICPGVNDVIRALVMSLYHHYGVKTIYGFPYGFEGLSWRYGHTIRELKPQNVNGIHGVGGSFLGSSRGPQDVSEMVDTLERLNVQMLFTIGGDGTLKGAGAIAAEIEKRGLKISIIGIPKTIDNDISFIEKSFGFETAVTEASKITNSAHNEATGARNGIGLVKLMGRDSGFIAAYSVLADNNVNFCLIPESPFSLGSFLSALRERMQRRGHAVIVVAEGAGQELMTQSNKMDASGNTCLCDIGIFLKNAITEYFNDLGIAANLKYIDPSYTIRSVPATPHDAAFCLLLGHNAVHAGMSGRTNMVVGYWKGEFTHVPISLAVSKRKKIDPEGWFWSTVIASTGQPNTMK